jgi:hypothetical protein
MLWFSNAVLLTQVIFSTRRHDVVKGREEKVGGVSPCKKLHKFIVPNLDTVDTCKLINFLRARNMITSACAYGRAGEGPKGGEMPVLLHFVIVYMLLQQ